MFSKVINRGASAARALPRRPAHGIARRSVTTDAASSHAEKEDVPTVSLAHQHDCMHASREEVDEQH
jgi:putative aminopeptidase FrvX